MTLLDLKISALAVRDYIFGFPSRVIRNYTVIRYAETFHDICISLWWAVHGVTLAVVQVVAFVLLLHMALINAFVPAWFKTYFVKPSAPVKV